MLEDMETRLSITLKRKAMHTQNTIVQESAKIKHHLSDVGVTVEALDEYLAGDTSLSDPGDEPGQELSLGWSFSLNEESLPTGPQFVRHITSADDDTYSAGTLSESGSDDGFDGEEPTGEEPEDGSEDSQKPGEEDSDGQEFNFELLDSAGEPVRKELYDLARDEDYIKEYAVKEMAPEILRELKKPSAAGKLALEVETPKEKIERLEEWIGCLKHFARLKSIHLGNTKQRILEHRQRSPMEVPEDEEKWEALSSACSDVSIRAIIPNDSSSSSASLANSGELINEAPVKTPSASAIENDDDDNNARSARNATAHSSRPHSPTRDRSSSPAVSSQDLAPRSPQRDLRANIIFDDSLPRGWEMKRNKKGQIYYVDHVMRSTMWERPVLESEIREVEGIGWRKWDVDWDEVEDGDGNDDESNGEVEDAPAKPSTLELRRRARTAALLTGFQIRSLTLPSGYQVAKPTELPAITRSPELKYHEEELKSYEKCNTSEEREETLHKYQRGAEVKVEKEQELAEAKAGREQKLAEAQIRRSNQQEAEYAGQWAEEQARSIETKNRDRQKTGQPSRHSRMSIMLGRIPLSDNSAAAELALPRSDELLNTLEQKRHLDQRSIAEFMVDKETKKQASLRPTPFPLGSYIPRFGEVVDDAFDYLRTAHDEQRRREQRRELEEYWDWWSN